MSLFIEKFDAEKIAWSYSFLFYPGDAKIFHTISYDGRIKIYEVRCMPNAAKMYRLRKDAEFDIKNVEGIYRYYYNPKDLELHKKLYNGAKPLIMLIRQNLNQPGMLLKFEQKNLS